MQPYESTVKAIGRLAISSWILMVGVHEVSGADQKSKTNAPNFLNLSSGNIETKAKNFWMDAKAPKGGDGSKTSPFASMEEAKNFFRNASTDENLPRIIWLSSGEYSVTESIVLEARDSGSEKSPLIFRAKPGEKVVFNANKRIPMEWWEKLDENALSRLHPSASREKMIMLDLKKHPIRHCDRFAPKNIFSTEWYIPELFLDGERQPLAQWPNHDEKIESNGDAGWVTCNGSKDFKSWFYKEAGNPQDAEGFNALATDGFQREQRWSKMLATGQELWVKGFWRTPWEPWTIRVESMDQKEGIFVLTTAPQGGMGSKYSSVVPGSSPVYRVGSGKECWKALNLLEEIDRPGEWALDVKSQKIYYWPLRDLQKSELAVSDMSDPILRLNGVSNVQFLGIEFVGGMGRQLELNDVREVRIAGCRFDQGGATALAMRDSEKVQILSNDIIRSAGGGILVEQCGDRQSLRSSEIILVNNHIHHIGQTSYIEAIYLKECVGVQIRNNLIHDVPKNAVTSYDVNNCIYELNEIHNIAQGESDNGAFYNYGGWTTYGNIFRYNFLHHNNRSNGMYSDDGDSGDIYYRNIIHDCNDGLKFGGGHDVIAYNNLFIQTKKQIIDDRGIARKYMLGTKYESRLRDMNPDAEPWLSYGQELRKKFSFSTNLWMEVLSSEYHPEYPNGSAMFENIAVKSGPFEKPRHGNVRVENNIAIDSIEEAEFRNFAQMDLRTNAPGILMFFPDLNQMFPLMGLQLDDFRKVVPTRVEHGGLYNRGEAGHSYNEDQMIGH
jgi:hypothetical protein